MIPGKERDGSRFFREILLALIFMASPGFSDTRVVTQLEGYASLVRVPEGPALLSALGLGKVDLSARGASNIRAELTLEILTGKDTVLRIPRAFLRYSPEGFRLTLGRAAASWGEGLVYNAGDLWAPAFDPSSSLASETVKDLSFWQAGLWIPLGDLAYFEALGAPPEGALVTPGLPPEWHQAAGGMRFYGDFGAAALQAGWNTDGKAGIHRIYGAFNTSLGPLGIYGNGGTAVAVSSDLWTEGLLGAALRGQTHSLGIFLTQELPEGQTWSGRMEVLSRPWEGWKGWEVYGDTSLALDQTLSVTLRALFHPEDLSAKLTLLGSWQADRGLTFLLLPSVNWGEPGDRYPWGVPGDLSLTGGFRLVF